MRKYLLLAVAVLLLVGCGNGVIPVRATAGAPPREAATSPPTAGPDGQRQNQPTAAPTSAVSPTPPAPSITVSDQAIGSNNTVTIGEAISPTAGWVVIHADSGGAPGEVIGHQYVEPGLNPDFQVEIDVRRVTDTLYAMLHTDTGTAGTFDFPDADPPVTDGQGNPIVEKFTVTQP